MSADDRMIDDRVTETEGGWLLPLGGFAVTRVFLDIDAWGLLLAGAEDNSATIRFSEATVSVAGQSTAVGANPVRGASVAPSLLGKTVNEASVDHASLIRVIFDDTSQLVVEGGAEYEAWEVSGPGRVFVVAPAGGDTPAIWDATSPSFRVDVRGDE